MNKKRRGAGISGIGRFILLASVCLSVSCRKDQLFDCFKSTGEIMTENREPAEITHIDLKNNVDLILVPNTTPYIKVTAGKNLIDGIITEVSGKTLYIRNENRCNWMRSFSNRFTVEVGLANLSKIDYYGSGDITCKDTLRTGEFFFDCWNGSGSIRLVFNSEKTHVNNNIGRADYHLSGYSGVSFIYMNDVAICDAANLVTYYSYIRNRSTGDCRVHVKTELSAEIEYQGDIYYSGNPPVVNRILNGDGKVIAY